MPVYIEGETTSIPADCLQIGLINNMPSAAVSATERQFANLLQAAASGVPVSLSFLCLPSRTAIESKRSYRSTEVLNRSRWDALLVTGAEPVGLDLRQDPIWQDLIQVVDWAREHTLSAIWSCLAAHAAVLHLDGVARQRRCTKLSGVFPCIEVGSHMLSIEHVSAFVTPHSRWNGLAERDLKETGYLLLSRTQEGEVNAFLKHTKSLFVFLQGHPEYEANTLLREYSRDVARFLNGQNPSYPATPSGYFDQPTGNALDCLRRHALSDPTPLLLNGVIDVLGQARVRNTWKGAAISFYRRWLIWLREQQKASRRGSVPNAPTRHVLPQPLSAGALNHDIDPA